ncbi:1,2-dihydroxy-3-keto-5-methylthiopentene dioxygenase [Marasmius sp. AFHP31]|nr:1,2-dihydroxy-3-keto-5-methylthiopentene dioxygenase [Marasmius sp. AFHP31]
MSLQAYYRDPNAGDLSSPQDSGRPVSEEKLRALGLKWWTVEGSLDERMKTFKELSKSLGFEDGDYEHLYDLSKQTGSPYDLTMAPKDVLESWGQDNLIPPPVLVLYISGKIYVDVKEPGTESFIRLAVPPKYAIFFPGGTVWQAFSPESLRDLSLRGTDRTSIHLVGEELDKHPARVDHVRSILDSDAVEAESKPSQ